MKHTLFFILLSIFSFGLFGQDIIMLNDVDTVQSFNPTTTHSELIGATTINGNAVTYLQMRTAGGGDGAKFLVRSAEKTNAVCDKITFGVRSRQGDEVTFDVSIAGESQTFNYTSVADTEDVDFDFDTPVTITEASQELELIVTALSNAGVAPRFRLYTVTFHLSNFLSNVDEVEFAQDLYVYPNPVKDVFGLSTEIQSGVLYNLSGQKVYEFKNQNNDIDISNLETGLYLLQAQLKNGSTKTIELVKD